MLPLNESGAITTRTGRPYPPAGWYGGRPRACRMAC
jgi:hypothetical protein